MKTASSVLATLPTLVVGWPQVGAKALEPKGKALPRLEIHLANTLFWVDLFVSS